MSDLCGNYERQASSRHQEAGGPNDERRPRGTQPGEPDPMGRTELQRSSPPATAESLVANGGWIADDRGEPAIRAGGPCEEVGGDGLGLRTPSSSQPSTSAATKFGHTRLGGSRRVRCRDDDLGQRGHGAGAGRCEKGGDMWPRGRRPGAFAPGQQFGEGPGRHEDRAGRDAPQDPDGPPSLHGLPYPSLQGGWAANVSLHRTERVVRMPNLTRRQVLRTTGVASLGLIAGA